MSTTVEVNVKVTGAKKAADEVSGIGEAADTSSDSMDSLSGAADNMTGGLVSGFKNGLKGVKSMTTGMKTLKGAIISTGVGALVVALGALVAWMHTTEKGAKAMKTAGIALDVVWKDITTSVGEATGALFESTEQADKFNEGVIEWSARLLGYGKVYDWLNPKIEEAAEIASRMVDAQDKLIETTIKLTVKNAELNKEIQAEQKHIDDTTLSYEERTSALAKQSKASEKLAANIADEARLAEQTIADQIEISKGHYEGLDLQQDLANATKNRIDAESSLAMVVLDNEQKTREIELVEIDRKKAIFSILQSALTESITNERKQLQAQQDDIEKATLAEMDRLRSTDDEKETFLRNHLAITSKMLKDYDDEKEAQRILDSEALAAKLKADQDKIDAAQKVKDDKEQADLNAKYERQDELDAFFNTEQENEIAAVTAQYEKLFGLAYEFEMDTEELTRRQAEANAAINKKYADQEIAEDKKVQTEKQANRQEALNAGMDAAASMVNFLAEMNEAADGASVQEQKKAFERNKKLQIAQALISASRGIINILSNSSTIPDPWGTIYKGVQIGMLAGVTAKQISKIKSEQFSGGGSVSDGGGASGSAALPQMTQGLVPSSFGDSATAPTSGSSTEIAPVQAFVVSSSVTNQQQLDAQISHQSSL